MADTMAIVTVAMEVVEITKGRTVATIMVATMGIAVAAIIKTVMGNIMPSRVAVT